MAVASVKIRKQSSKLTAGRRSHEQEYVVRFDAIAASNSADALTAVDPNTPADKIPVYGEAHSSGDGTYCSEVHADGEGKSMLVFIVSVSFIQPAIQIGGDAQSYIDPLLRPPDISWNSVVTTENYFLDVDGDPVVNSSGEAFDNDPMRESSATEIVIERNELFNDIVSQGALRDCMNEDPVMIDGELYEPFSLKLGPIQSRKMFERDPNGVMVQYYRKTYTLRFRAELWVEDFVDRGYMELDVFGKQVPILDKTGQRVSKSWPLNGHGAAMPNAGDTPASLLFRPYADVTFAGLMFM